MNKEKFLNLIISSFLKEEQESEKLIHDEFLGKLCLIRTYSAGVFIGKVENINNQTILMSNCRRLWYWKEAFTLSKVATAGAGEGTRISCATEKQLIFQLIEIIPLTEKAIKSLEKYYED